MKRILATALLLFTARSEAAFTTGSGLTSSTAETIAIAPTATLTIDGTTTSLTPLNLSQTSDGVIVGTVVVKRTVSRIARADSAVTSGALVLWLTPAAGAPPLVMVGTLQPSDLGMTVRAYPIQHGLCDPDSLTESLTSLRSEKSQILGEISALENALIAAELADGAACQAAFENAVDALTLEIPAAALLGDLALQAELTSQLDALKLRPQVCDSAGVDALHAALALVISRLALVDVAIQDLLVESKNCQ